MSTIEGNIEVPADLIRDVRLGALGLLHTAAHDLEGHAETYLESDGAREAHEYGQAFERVRSLQGLLEVLGDDLTGPSEPVNLSSEWRELICQAAIDKAVHLRYSLGDRLPDDTEELQSAVERIARLENFAAELAPVAA